MVDTDRRRILFGAHVLRVSEIFEIEPLGAACRLRLCAPRAALRPRPGRVRGHPPRRPPATRTRGPHAVDALVPAPHAPRVAPYLYPGRRVIVHGRIESPAGAEHQARCLIAERVELHGRAPRAGLLQRI